MGRWEGGERAQIRLTKFTKDCPRAPSCMATHIPKPRTSETLPHPPLRPLAQAPILTGERFPKGPSGWARGEQIPALFAGLRMAAPTGGGVAEVVEQGLFFHKLSTSVNMRESDQTEGSGGGYQHPRRRRRREGKSTWREEVFLKIQFFLIERQKLLLAR